MIIKFTRWSYTKEGDVITVNNKPKQIYFIKDELEKWFVENDIQHGFEIEYHRGFDVSLQQTDSYWCFNSIFAHVSESQALMAKLVWGTDVLIESNVI